MTSKKSERIIEKEAIRKLFSGHLGRNTTDDTFKQHFEKFGNVVDAFISRNPMTMESKSFGFIKFENSICVLEALASRPHILRWKGCGCQKSDSKGEHNRNGPQKDKNVICRWSSFKCYRS
eukprot:gene13433-14814_t